MATKSLTPEEVENLVRPKPNHRRFVDLEGRTFGSVAVGRYCGVGHASLWECVCGICGRRYVTAYSSLVRPGTKSCGCHARALIVEISTKHGMAGSKEYRSWQHLKERCQNKSCKNYKDYGGRGISVCREWSNSFEEFLDHVGPAPSAKHEIDRINNNGNYEPGNVRWATKKEQQRNKRLSRWLTVSGDTKTLAGWAEIYGLKWDTVWMRIKRGWDIEKAVSTAIRPRELPRGVYRSGNKFRARTEVGGKKIDLGTHKTVEEAEAAYVRATKYANSQST